MSYLLIIGFISILGQVVILRELNVAFYGIELIYILAMGIWLFWSAIGALIGRRAYTPSANIIRFLLILFAILLPADVAFIRGVRLLFGGIPGSYLPFGQQIMAISVSLFPVGILLGLLFQWAAKLYIGKNEDKTLALAYAIESAGAIIGGLASTLLMHFGVQNFAVSVLCSILAVLSVIGEQRGKQSHFEMLTFAVLTLVFFFSPVIDHQMTRWNHPHLLDTRDSPYSRITIEGRSGQFVIFENDVLGFETESTAAEEFVHLASIQHEHPGQIFIAGGGVEGIVGEMLKHGPRSVDYVELNPVLLDLAQKHLPEKYRKSLESETVTVFNADPRNFLNSSLETGTPAKAYDLMLVGMSEPGSGQSNRFYTREYFRQCADRLEPDGILAFRLRSSENLWTQFLRYRNTSIWLALTSVFQDVLVLPGTTNIVLASYTPLTRNPDTLIERFNERGIKARLITPAYIRYVLTNDRFYDIEKQISSTDALPNTDIRPACYQYSGMMWLSKFIPGIIHWNLSLFNISNRMWIISGICIMFCTGVLFFIARSRLRLKRVLLAALAGFMGMILETMLILHYQAKSGVLFQDIGILLMVFMAGLTAGSVAMMKKARKTVENQIVRHISKNSFSDNNYDMVPQKSGNALLIGFGILSLIFIGLLRSGYPSGLFVISLLLFITGFLVSGVFTFASLIGVKNQKIVVSPLYAADLLGGCIGSLLGSLIFIPFFGMEHSAIMMTALALAALFIL